MPSSLQTAYRRPLIAVSCVLVAIALSGCRAIGTNKPAALQITSIPEASVFLDGKHLGKTPYSSDQLKAGEHTLKLSASEASYLERVTLNSGTLTVVNRELTNNFLAQSGEVLSLEPSGQGLFISSSPDQASVTLDGRLIGTSPLLLEDIKEGEHKLLITKGGYQDREIALKTSSKYQLVASITLANITAKQPPASPMPVVKVQVTSTPAGFLRVRKEPSLTSTEIGRVKTGDQLEVIQDLKEWLQVKFEGKIGWISSTYTKKI